MKPGLMVALACMFFGAWSVAGFAAQPELGPELRSHGTIVLLIEPQSGAIIDANLSAAAFYGYSVSRLRTMRIQDINMFNPDDVAAERKRAETEQRNYFVFPHRLANGDVRTVEVHSSPFELADGRRVLLSIIHDATNKALVEAENLEYRSRLEELAAQRTDEALAAHVRTTRILIAGLFIFFGLMFWLSRKHRMAVFYRRQYELEQERNQAVDELSSAHEEMAQLVAAIPSLLISLNANHYVVRWNHEAERLFGLTPESVTNRLLRDCDLSWQWQAVLEALHECRQTRGHVRLEDLPYTQMDGAPGFLGLTVSLIDKQNGDVFGFLILGRDVTRMRLMESQLHQAQKLESIGHLAAGVAHEINTPIQYIGNNLTFLRDSCDDVKNMILVYDALLEASRLIPALAEPVRAIETNKADINLNFLIEEFGTSLQEVQSGVDRVAGIVQSMRMLSHPGRQNKMMVDLNKTLETMLIVTRHEWKNLIDLATDLQPDLPPVSCLAAEISQAILNILVNAIQAVDEQVQAGKIRRGRIFMSSHHDDGWVEIRFADNGGGIAPDHRGRVFDPFFTTKDVGKGTGQGLAIAHAIIVGKHGGMLTFETRMGEGTTFIIRLPVAEQGREEELAP